MNKKIIMISMVAVFVGWGAYANTVDIDANGNRLNSNPAVAANCTEPILGTYSGSTDFEAKWQANSIPLRWYSDDEQLTVQGAAGTCTYDSGLTVPSSQYQPTKRGYHFRGWTIRTDSGDGGALLCGLTESDLDTMSFSGTLYGYIADSRYNGTSLNAATYGLNEDNTWAMEFDDGAIIKGIASCNDTPEPDLSSYVDQEDDLIMALNNGTITDDEYYTQSTALGNSKWSSSDMISVSNMSTSSEGEYCWCKVTSYTPNGGNICSIGSSTAWGFLSHFGDARPCGRACAKACYSVLMRYSGARRALLTAH